MKKVYQGPDGLTYETPTRSDREPDCVAVAKLPSGGVRLRNSNQEDGSYIDYTASEWDAFTGSVKDGQFD